ncbi:MAG TPA: hypothetical protein VLB90_00460 [Pseudomonadales bacterium]|nr:hypothetical protein [Pseudomonadales bacterium]
MKYIKQFFLAVTLLAVGGFVWWAGMNYTGYCHAEGRYLSDEEKIDLAIRDILQTYPPVLTENAVGVIHSKRPENPVYYTDITEFKSSNNNCCNITQVGPEGKNDRASLYSRITGRISGFVHVKYLVRYKDEQGTGLSKSIDTYPAITNCGAIWSGI